MLRGAELGVEPSTVMRHLFDPAAMIPLERLAEVQVPTRRTKVRRTLVRLISDGQDPLVPTKHIREFSKHIPNAAFEVFEDSGHSPYFEVPDAFNALVAKYLEQFLAP